MSIRNKKITSMQKVNLSNQYFLSRKEKVMQYDYQRMQQTQRNVTESEMDSYCYTEEDSIYTPTDINILGRISSLAPLTSRSNKKESYRSNQIPISSNFDYNHKEFDNLKVSNQKESPKEYKAQSIFNQGIYFNKASMEDQTVQNQKGIKNRINPKNGKKFQLKVSKDFSDVPLSPIFPVKHFQNGDSDLKWQSIQNSNQHNLSISSLQLGYQCIIPKRSYTLNSPEQTQNFKEEKIEQNNIPKSNSLNLPQADGKQSFSSNQTLENSPQKLTAPKHAFQKQIQHFQIKRDQVTNQLQKSGSVQNEFTPKLILQESPKELPSINSKSGLFTQRQQTLQTQIEQKKNQQVVQQFLNSQNKRKSKILQKDDQSQLSQQDEEEKKDQSENQAKEKITQQSYKNNFLCTFIQPQNELIRKSYKKIA